MLYLYYTFLIYIFNNIMNIDTLILSHTALMLCEMDSRLETRGFITDPNLSFNLAITGVCDIFYNLPTNKMIMNPNSIGGYNEIEITDFLNKINKIN